MKITVVTTIYKQQGPIFGFYAETEKQYQTSKYKGDVALGCRNLLTDFRKHKLIMNNDMISFKQLYINNQLVAMIEPRFIINDEVFESLEDCYVAYGEALSINDIKIIKELTHVNRQAIIDILSVNQQN